MAGPRLQRSLQARSCDACGYDLSGLIQERVRITCPECGLKQSWQARPESWPHGWREVALQSGITLALCNLCLLLLVIQEFNPAFGGPPFWLTAVTFLSGPVAPIVSACRLARRHGPEGIHEFIVLGWVWNLLIGVGYLLAAFAVVASV
jgi:hypothetical protein